MSELNNKLPSSRSNTSLESKKDLNPNLNGNSHVSQFYLKLYEQALQSDSKTNVNHDILQLRSSAMTVSAEGARSIHGKVDAEGVMLPATIQNKMESIKLDRDRIENGHKVFLQKLLEQEALLQMNEERRLKAQQEIVIKQSTAEVQRLEAEVLLKRGLKVHEETLNTKDTVESYRTYKDYVERSVPLWGKEAETVEAVCGRYRDLLNLRFQLMQQVEEQFVELTKLREFYQKLVKSEKICEGRALLQVYRQRSSQWKFNKESEASENKLRALRMVSTDIATRLTRVRLALANMYSVARRFQVSLHPLTPNSPPTEILKRLHNFLLDATKVVELAKLEHTSDSMMPAKGSNI